MLEAKQVIYRIHAPRNLRSCDPGDLGREALDVVLFTLQDLGRDKHGEVRVLDAHFLDLAVEPFCATVSP